MQSLGRKTRTLLMGRTDDNENEVRKWRVVPLAAEFVLLLPIAEEIVVPRELDARRKWREALDEDLAFDFTSPGGWTPRRPRSA